MKLTPERHQEILKAVFGHLVKKALIEKKLIFRSGDSTDLTAVVKLSKLLNCQSHSLFIAIEAAVYKMNNTKLPDKRLEYLAEEEPVTEAMISAIKYKLKTLRLVNLPQIIHNSTEELNENDRELDLMTSELACFFHPIYLDVAKETFGLLELIPNF